MLCQKKVSLLLVISDGFLLDIGSRFVMNLKARHIRMILVANFMISQHIPQIFKTLR